MPVTREPGTVRAEEGPSRAGEASLPERVAIRAREEARLLQALEADFARLPGEARVPCEPPEAADAATASEASEAAVAPEPPRSDAGGESEDPLLEACRAALRSLGVELTAPPPLDPSAPAQERIEAIGRAAGVRARPVRVPPHAWTPEAEAFVAFRALAGGRTEPIALRPGVRVDRRLARSLDPMACCFSRPLPRGPLRLRDLWTYVRAGTVGIGMRVGAAWLASAALGFLVPTLIACFFDEVVPAGRPSALVTTVLALALATTSLLVFDLAAALRRLHFRARIGRVLEAGIMDRLLGLPVALFRRYPVADLLARTGVADGQHESALMSALAGASAAALALSSLAALLLLDLRLGLVALAAGALLLGVNAAVLARRMRLERVLVSNALALRSFLLQLFGAISAVRSAGAETWVFSRWAELFHRRRTLEYASSRIASSIAVVNDVLPVACAAAFFAILAPGLSGPPSPSGGHYLASLQALSVFVAALLRFGEASAELARAAPLVERARPILSVPPERAPTGRRPGRLSGRVELRDLWFRYASTGPWVLEDVEVRIEPGQLVALVGPSGSGKSTLVRLLLGFDRPSRGAILYDGEPLAALDVCEVRRQMGAVLQHDQLTSGTIFENISAGRPLSLERAWEAARLAGLHEELRRWPMGMHSLVTQGARAFSGGERQRLMVARALAGEPRLLLLDEATSALDNRVQAEVMRNLAALRVTRILVAHRLSTIQGADLVLVFDRGRIVERGDYASLLARGGALARLVRRQQWG